jgi:Protein of unknown function (DUF2652)
MAGGDRLESGFLVLADISGFTAFVTATELEHGAEVTGVLLAGVMEALAPPLEIQELEGDAVFALAPDNVDERDRTLMDAFGRAFEAFGERQREISLDTSCYCGACRGVLGLSLKLMVHHGSFMRQVVRGRVPTSSSRTDSSRTTSSPGLTCSSLTLRSSASGSIPSRPAWSGTRASTPTSTSATASWSRSTVSGGAARA